jgi:hypothetical protein
MLKLSVTHFNVTILSQQQHLLAFLETALLITEETGLLIHYGYASIS